MWSGVEKAARTFFSSTHPSWQAKDSSCHQFLWSYECPNGGERAGDHRSSLFSQPHFFWPTKCDASSGIVRKSPVLKIYFDRKRVLGKPTEGPKFTLYCMRMPERLCDAEVHDLRKSMILQTWRLPIPDTNAAGMQSERAACTWGTHWTTDRPHFEVVHPFWSCESGQWPPWKLLHNIFDLKIRGLSDLWTDMSEGDGVSEFAFQGWTFYSLQWLSSIRENPHLACDGEDISSPFFIWFLTLEQECCSYPLSRMFSSLIVFVQMNCFQKDHWLSQLTSLKEGEDDGDSHFFSGPGPGRSRVGKATIQVSFGSREPTLFRNSKATHLCKRRSVTGLGHQATC